MSIFIIISTVGVYKSNLKNSQKEIINDLNLTMEESFVVDKDYKEMDKVKIYIGEKAYIVERQDNDLVMEEIKLIKK